jgi:Protein of unknown function (DUF1595)/Protein of unknown function (DUF1587)
VLPPELKGNGFNNDAASLNTSRVLVDGYHQVAATLAQQVTSDAASLAKLSPCDRATQGDDTCAKTFIADFGRKAFRRSLTDAESTTLYRVYQAGKEGTGYIDGVKAVIQLLGTPSAGGSKNANLCQPGGMTVSKLFGQALADSGCHDSKSGTAPAADQWVTVEAEVHVTGDTKVYQYPEMTNPVLTFSGTKYKGQPVTGGYLALQSESQPVEFKDIQLKEMK